MRPTLLEGAESPRRGLILHHQAHPPFQRDQPAPWVGEALMARINELLTAADAAGGRGAVPLPEYRDADVSGGRPYWGAMKPVVDYRADGEVLNTQWLVLVQEPAPR